MFRDTVEELAHDLAQFVHRVVHGGGIQVQDSQGSRYTIMVDPQRGNPADVALLCSSPRELDAQGRPRLPLLLREELSQLSPPIQIFNPRGQNLELIPDVQRLCGLILECIDPRGIVQDNTRGLPQSVIDTFNDWRDEAMDYINTNPQPHNPTLKQFVDAWQRRNSLGRRNRRIDPEVPLISLVYKLVTWIPSMQNDIEGLVYLEAITRTINQAGLFSSFGGQIIFDQNDPRAEPSIREALWNIFMPIATGAIEINEDLLETLPSDRLNIMSIHQAKGLEFPLVIVDVGSDFRTNHYAHAFKRFPNNGGKSCNIEDELRPYSPLGIPQRPALDRAFDDLIRQYFVAFSRAQDVLMYVGLNSVRDGYLTSSGRREIPNIATGWNRKSNWIWGRGLPNLIHI
jgi:DNA helicase-2/ATP-dependent DNA helicase PcrA